MSTTQVSGNFSLSPRNLRKDFRPGKEDKKLRLVLSRQWRGRMEEEWAKDRQEPGLGSQGGASIHRCEHLSERVWRCPRG